MMVAGVALFKSRQVLDGIIIVRDGASIVFAAGAVKLWAQILRWTRDLRAGFQADAAGEAGGNHDGFAASGHSFKLYHAFIDINFSHATAVNFDVKFCAAHGNHSAGCSDLESR